MARLDAQHTEYPWSSDLYRRVCEGASAHRWALLADDNVPSLVGFVVCEQVLEQASILNLVVAGDARRQGIGRALMQAAFDKMRLAGGKQCHLEVRAGNSAAIGLYRMLGFVETGVRRGYYRGATVEDARLFSLELEQHP